MPLTIRSAAFEPNSPIPTRHTCEGDDVSPPLEWSGAPEGTASLVLIVDDPDAPDPAAPTMTYVHWVLYDLPPGTAGLPAGVATDALPAGARAGQNDWKRRGWGGPCPPIGRHRYFFKLFALDATLDAGLGAVGAAGATKAEIEAAMAGHVLEAAELVGTYQKK